MAKVNDTLGVWAKKGYVMVGDKLVKSEELVSKGKVEKIEPVSLSGKLPIVELPHIAISNFIKDGFQALNNSKPVQDLSMAQGMAILAKQRLDAFNETGVLFTEAYPEDVFLLPTGELLKVKYRFNIKPCPAPRMSQSDKWKLDPNALDPKMRQRPCVTRYFEWRGNFIPMCKEAGYDLTPVLDVLFVVPFPKSYNKKKRERLFNTEHQLRPDRDNFLKSVQDSFDVDDGFVWDGRTTKVWGEVGQIIIF